jgi:hypothetical protein
MAGQGQVVSVEEERRDARPASMRMLIPADAATSGIDPADEGNR